MVFSTPFFIFAFLPLCLAGYYLVCGKSRKAQNVLLLIFSLIFYAWGGIRHLFLMLFSIVFNWFSARKIDGDKHRKAYLIFAITGNLLTLFIFKYLTFTVRNVNALFGANIPIRDIALPIGISFFTFQAMSYVIDVYRKKGESLKSLLDVGLYISLFPQLIAGPIVRYADIKDQIRNRKESFDLFCEGIFKFSVGLAKKVVIANQLAVVAERAFGTTDKNVLLSWMGIISFTLQIYYDFSGYSDMAIGLGRMFGFSFRRNFDYPYISSSISEFWRRWHISMGSWFRDYVYFPLGGSRVSSKARLYLNLLIVWLLTGLWHGANWTFVFWGLIQFFVIALEKTFIKKESVPSTHYAVRFVRHFYTMAVVMLGWLFFNSASISDGFKYISGLFYSSAGAYDVYTLNLLNNNIIIIIVAVIFCTPVLGSIYGKTHSPVLRRSYKTGFTALCLVLGLIYTVKGSYNPFIYFNF